MSVPRHTESCTGLQGGGCCGLWGVEAHRKPDGQRVREGVLLSAALEALASAGTAILLAYSCSRDSPQELQL